MCVHTGVSSAQGLCLEMVLSFHPLPRRPGCRPNGRIESPVPAGLPGLTLLGSGSQSPMSPVSFAWVGLCVRVDLHPA